MKIFIAFALFFFLSRSFANEYRCKVELHKESAKANTGALNCGEFNFETTGKSTKKQVFDKCQNVTIEYTSTQTPKGLESFIRISTVKEANLKNLSEHSSLAAHSLPIEFRLEKATPRLERKHVLYETYILDCTQSKTE